MPRKRMPVEQILALLTESPKRIDEVTDALTPAQAHAAPEPGEWSVNEVLAHLRACADVWGDCIATILAEDQPTIRAIKPKRWIKSTDYPELDFRPSLGTFTEQRSELLASLLRLNEDDWACVAIVTGAGRPIERSLLSFADRMARHERSHRKQIERAAGASSF